MSMLKKLFTEESGQGMVEYGLILVLVAVVVIGALTAMGTGLDGVFETINGQLPGSTN
jgi:pilus assembly protein Flp/PilA